MRQKEVMVVTLRSYYIERDGINLAIKVDWTLIRKENLVKIDRGEHIKPLNEEYNGR